MSAKGRLSRSFPSSSVSVNLEQAQDRGLLAELANMLVQMSHEAVPGQRPKVKKAGGWHDEDRDTIHPGMVTEFLEGIVASVGSLVSSPSVTKNTREEVSWRDARHPWRRSPVWLLLRVSLQLAFKEFMPEPLDGQRVYKSFMVFMMSQILSSSKKPQMPVDILYAMNAKIARRLNKLHNIDFALLQKIRESMNETHEEITKRWHLQQESDVRCLDLEQLCKLDFEKDSVLHFPEMAEYLSTTKAPDNSGIGSDFRPINELVTYAHDDLPKGIGDQVPTHNVLFRLNAFENWIANSLKVWTESHRTEGDCAALAKLLESYSQIATREYKGNPEATSVMVLVSIEMWISCDQIATSICPLLRDYEPGIPIERLQNLLLPFADQERRLNLVEEYLTTRKDQSHMNDLTSQVVGDPEAFSVRYFDESAEHQKMLREISADADRAREAKLMRWRELKHEYNHLMSMHNQIPDCTYIEHVIDRRYGTTTRRHSSECSKCSYKARASGLSLDVHEWPLPSRTLDAKTVILELAPPTWLVHLRDVTADVQQSILTARYGSIHKPRSNHRLENDPHLANLRRGVINRRLGLLSEVKPHVGTHRRGKSLATASESDICVQNGLSYSYFDKHETCFVDSLIWTEDILHACTYQLPSRAASLQKFLFRPASCPQGPSPNTVIAEQFTCPDHMTIQEFKELSDIPLGTSLQWWNIAVQLKAPLVDINRPEAVLIILQCIYQVGPPPQPGLTIRGSHEMLQTSEFCWVLLDALKEALSRITHNWACVMSLRALVAIARRLLSLSSVGDVQTACFGYLAEARTVSFRWVNILHKSAQGANSDKARKDLERRVFEAAITCVSTFDLDQKYQDALLGSEYASILLQCSIIIKQRIDISDCFSGTTRFLYERYQRVLQNTCHILAANQHSLHDAVGRSCVVYQHGSKWVLADGTGNWIISHFAQSKFETRSTASLNLLTGELLINGLPLDRLPAEYRSSTRYTDLFGNSILEVVQSRTSGMAFDSKGKYYGFSLQFKMHAIPGSKSRDLIVLALNGEEDYTILPSNLLEACLPSFFVENYIHWYDNKNERVEFRPKSKPWIRDTRECWILEKCSEDSKWQLTRSRDEAVLVGSKSSTAIALSRILSPLAKPLQLHLILSPNRQFLNVELNGLSLGFSLRKGSSCLRSREYVHMYVDPNQRLGTLIGFTNKLLLTDETNANRVVIVTEGRITIKQWNFDSEHFTTSSQVHASVDLHTAYALHTFQVRPHLCNLGGNGSLESELYLAYLHAITSCCLQDPFTKKTGTERALQILCSARVASFLRLSKQSLGLLQLIGKLTPHRAYYPTNLRDMQTVEWHKNLSFLSQHPRFHTTVKSIFAQAERQRFLLPDTDLRYPELNDIHPTLQERDEIRSSMFRVCEFGAEDFTTAHDVMYPGRGLAEDSDRRLNALTVCRMILNECVKVPWKIHEDCVWRLLKQNPQRSVTGFTMELPQLRYQARFIEEAESIVAENWSKAYLLLTQQNPRPNKYAVMIWLSTLACSKIDRGVLTMLALAFTRAEFQSRAPTDEFIKISDGIDVRPHLRAIIEHHVRDFHSSPEDRQSRLPNESRKAFGHRVHNAFQTNKGQAVRILESGLAHQWPCAVPSTPKDTEPLRISDYVDKSAVIPPIREIFKSCFANLKMHEFLRHLEKLAEGISVERVNYPGRPASSITAFETVTGFISIDDLFNRPAPSVTAFDGNFSSHTQERGTANLTRLRIFLDELSESLTESEYHSRYIKTLESSFDALQQGDHTGQSSIPNMRLLDAAQTMYSEQVHSIESTLIAALSHEGDHLNRHRAVSEEIGQGPRIGPDLLLQQLSRMRWNGLGIPWRRCIIAYGVALIALRRVQRVIAFHKAGKEAEAAQDWHNVPHRNWDPYDYPETLLLEVESGITIRERQEQVAAEMRKPQGKHNASMQLNMGEGKSSVIAPIVAAALADGTCLVRIVVAKPQSKQMTQMLISKLGGLIGRRIFFLPISRSLRLDKAAANSIDQMCHECMKSGGILLVQPEHLLSFQLMVLDRYIAGETATAEILSRTQNFLDENSRDIVDEGDENFNVKFELIYTMGSQLPIDASPDRWIHIGELLDLVKTFAEQVIQSLPSSISVQYSSPGAFPYLRILRTDAGRLLEELIATKICKIGLRGFPIARQPPDVRDAVYTYITKRDITKSEARLVENPDSNSFFTETLRPKLYLLRGLIAGGVLSFVLFRKRWCVNYGLDLQRVPATRLAVPYRSKDQPSLRSDFSHPDVVILLTYLSYYYGGLTDDDMVLAFHNLMSSDQRDTEYQEWVMNVSNLSEGFRRLEGINLEDRQTLVAQVFPHLRKVKNVVDFFLNNIVFPKELRVFPEKLSASGWDIGKVKRHPTTAFSGTCDTHPLLPLSIEHLDLPHQRHTNALVLNHLLQPENQVLRLASAHVRQETDAEMILSAVLSTNPQPRVIIDVGALVLDMGNEQLARTWLERHTSDSAEAVVFFDDHDELSTIDRAGNVERLQTSPFSSRLSSCLIFLDEAHTRGTDLKLPTDYRAAVTLGPSLTKDRLIQGGTATTQKFITLGLIY